MTAQATRHRLRTGVLWGGFGVLAWAVLTLFAGGDAAHAEESNENPLGRLVSQVTETVTTPVAAVVTDVVAPVVTAAVAPVQQAAPQAAAAVTQTVQQIPVVGPAAASVVQNSAGAVVSVTTPVTGLLQNDPLTQIAAPVLDAVVGVPVVGDLVDGLGVPDLIDDTLGLADDVVGVVGGVVSDTVSPVLEGMDPPTPAAPGSPTPPPGSVTDPGAGTGGGTIESPLPDQRAVSDDPVMMSADFPRATAEVTTSHAPGAVVATLALPGGAAPPPVESPTHLPSAAPATHSSSPSGSGGGASSAARVVDGGIPSLHAWTLSSGVTADTLPPSPLADTDVSPD